MNEKNFQLQPQGCCNNMDNISIGGVSTSKSCPALATPWTVACQAPLSIEFPRQEYWSGLPFPSSGDLPDPEIKPGLLCFRWFPPLQADFFLTN